MKDQANTYDQGELLRRLEEAEATLDAIRRGEVDAVVVGGREIYALEGADHPYRVLVEAMPQGAVTATQDGTMIYCNASFARMLGCPFEKVIGQQLVEQFSASDHPALRKLLAADPSEVWQVELSLRAHNGTEMPVLVSRTVLPLSGTTALCLVITDLTEHKQNQQLQASDRRKDEFLAMLAHELRNPLAPISNAVQMLCLASHSDRASIHLACEIIERQVQQMSRIVDDLLDVSRITRGKINLQLVPTDVSTIVANAVETSRPLIESRKQTLHITLANEQLRVNADSTRMAQVLTNVLNNAAKYTQDGGHIWLSVERRNQQVAISIRDNGTGMSPEMLATIFDLFTQAEQTIDRSQGGLGIGLTLVRRLVELHRGTVTANSNGLGKGSELVVSLPLFLQMNAVNGQSARDAAVLPTMPPQRILVVDDNIDAARTLVLLLQANGHTVEMAHDGPKALELATSFLPNIMLLDIGLPGMNGYVVAAKIRELAGTACPCLVAITGYGEEQDRQRTSAAGFDHHLVKPVSFRALQELLGKTHVSQ